MAQAAQAGIRGRMSSGSLTLFNIILLCSCDSSLFDSEAKSSSVNFRSSSLDTTSSILCLLCLIDCRSIDYVTSNVFDRILFAKIYYNIM